MHGETPGKEATMEKVEVDFGRDFAVLAGNGRAQAAVMVLGAGETTGGPDNRHRGSDQWLYVVSGEGVATVAGRREALRAGTLLRIDRGEAHEIRNEGAGPLETINVYVPPAYTADGETLPAGEG